MAHALSYPPGPTSTTETQQRTVWLTSGHGRPPARRHRHRCRRDHVLHSCGGDIHRWVSWLQTYLFRFKIQNPLLIPQRGNSQSHEHVYFCTVNSFIQWWKVTKYIYLNTVLEYNLEVLVLYFSISILCYFILLFYYYNSEVNFVLFTALHCFNNISYFTDNTILLLQDNYL